MKKDTDKPFPLTSVSVLGCDKSVSDNIKLTHKLTDMIASGVDFAKVYYRYVLYMYYL